MTFRTRLTLGVALAVAVAVAGASALTYVLVRGELRSEIDDALRERVGSVRSLRVVNDRSGNPFLDLPPTRFGGAQGITQLVTSDGVAIQSPDASVELPVTERARQVAAGDGDSFFADVDVSGTHLRVYTVPVDRPGLALQIARPLDEVDAALGPDPRPARPDRRHRRRAGRRDRLRRLARRARTCPATDASGRGRHRDA